MQGILTETANGSVTGFVAIPSVTYFPANTNKTLDYRYSGTIRTGVWSKYFSFDLLGTASKPNPRLTGGSVRFHPVSIVLNNDNRPEPDGTAGQPAVGF